MDTETADLIVRRMVGRCGAWLAELELVEATAEALRLAAPAHGELVWACSADLRAYRRDTLGIPDPCNPVDL